AEYARGIAMAQLRLCAHPAVVFVPRLNHDVDGRIGARLPAQRTTDGKEISAVDMVRHVNVSVSLVVDIVDRSVAILPIPREPHAQLSVDDREIAHRAGFLIVEIAVGALD